jgi:hypothetical protein
MSGKSTGAIYLATKPKVERMAFANALKYEIFDGLWKFPTEQDVVQALERFQREVGGKLLLPDYEFPGRDLYYVSKEEKLAWVNLHKVELRPLLQWWGTEYRRSQDPDYWVRQLEAQAWESIADGNVVVVDDCRFENEREALREMGLLDIWVYNPNVPESVGIAGHASEAMGERGADLVISNSSTLEMYYRTLDTVIACNIPADVTRK